MSTWIGTESTTARGACAPYRRLPTTAEPRPAFRAPTSEEALRAAIALMDAGRPAAADAALTAALVADAHNADLWLAAGVARLRRGANAAAQSAFRMCAWISGDTLAREIAGLL
jgi:Tfp pilus assembly protein PilF